MNSVYTCKIYNGTLFLLNQWITKPLKKCAIEPLGSFRIYKTIVIYKTVVQREQASSNEMFNTTSTHKKITESVVQREQAKSNRMLFGLSNAPATYQRVMDNVLHDLNGTGCLIYLDGIIIFSSSIQEHIAHLRQVPKTLPH